MIMQYVTIWCLSAPNLWVIERTHSIDYAKLLLGDTLQKEYSGKLYKAFPENVNPNDN